MLEKLEIKEWLSLNAKLQVKKNALRKELKQIGVLAKDKENKFDHYSYFSEGGYKKLFTDLFSKYGLELKFNEEEYTPFEVEGKQPNGRNTKLSFSLIDVETGFYETSSITGEGIDKGDKAGYKAYTGALKYYLANTFMVATGDDAENESPEAKGGATNQSSNQSMATANQIKMILGLYAKEEIKAMLQRMNLQSLEQITVQQASTMIKARKDKQNEQSN